MKVRIIKQGINGEGIAYYKRKPIFIDGVIKDEDVIIDNLKDYGTYYKASLRQIITKSKYRIKSKCEYYKRCGACSLLHVDYQMQLKIKAEIIKESAYKYAGLKLDPKIIKNDETFNYRSELKLPLINHHHKLSLAFYEVNSNISFSVKKCLIHDENLEKMARLILSHLDELGLKAKYKKEKGLRYLILRRLSDNYQAELISDDPKHLSLIKKMKVIPKLSLTYSFNESKYPLLKQAKAIKIFGDERIKYTLFDKSFYISNRSFMQLNLNQSMKAYKKIIDKIEKAGVIVEEYAGCGILAMLLAHKCQKYYAAEINPYAISDFKLNSQLNKIKNIIIKESDAAKHLKIINENIDYLILDPAREGLNEEMLKTIKKKKINNIVYMSCNHATLFKNLNHLLKDYMIDEMFFYDFFSHSAHIESLVFLKKIN